MRTILLDHGINWIVCVLAVLKQRTEKDAKKVFLQDWLLAISPSVVYGFTPIPAAIFLWNGPSKQFLFAVLPATAQRSQALRLLAAAYEFHVVLMWMAIIGHFGTFHSITFLRVIQRELMNNLANLEWVKGRSLCFMPPVWLIL